MENVPRLARHPVFAEFVRGLEDAGYKVTYDRLRAEQFGVPQRRTRLVLLASRLGEIALPNPTHIGRPLTVRDAIGKLPKIAAGALNNEDRLHVTRGLSALNARRLKSTKEGGSWKDWDEDLQLRCHKRKSGKSFRSVYGRMTWDEPAPVITTQCLGIGNGRFGHPEQDRAISIREAALLQTFPKRFRFARSDDKLSGLQLARQIGNAVPVKLGSAIARAIKRHLANVAA
jgi:DNA (cytosine-5)-methyltransferase 1